LNYPESCEASYARFFLHPQIRHGDRGAPR
jgi:hypothetical protein